jgi:monofunctional glycosyltransferase
MIFFKRFISPVFAVIRNVIFWRRFGRIVQLVVEVFVILSLFSVFLFRFIPVPVTPLMLIRCGGQLMDGQEMKMVRKWKPLEKISPAMPLAVIAAEDQRFEEHFGFDMEAIRKASSHNRRSKGRRVRGASTISQQTAKNLFLWPHRSWIRKGFEVYFTFLLEICWDKRRIMEVYLNIIETGPGMYGVEAAARKYFHKPASRLSVTESARIASILPNPSHFNPLRPTPRLEKKTKRILYFMSKLETRDFRL